MYHVEIALCDMSRPGPAAMPHKPPVTSFSDPDPPSLGVPCIYCIN